MLSRGCDARGREASGWPLVAEAAWSQMIETLPALLNNVKMMQQISRYYNTQSRMTSLYSKITNQMITNCRRNIVLEGSLWDQDPVEVGRRKGHQSGSSHQNQPNPDPNPNQVVKAMEVCLQLYEAYQEQYQVSMALNDGDVP